MSCKSNNQSKTRQSNSNGFLFGNPRMHSENNPFLERSIASLCEVEMQVHFYKYILGTLLFRRCFIQPPSTSACFSSSGTNVHSYWTDHENIVWCSLRNHCKEKKNIPKYSSFFGIPEVAMASLSDTTQTVLLRSDRRYSWILDAHKDFPLLGNPVMMIKGMTHKL